MPDDFIIQLTEGTLIPALYLGALYAGVSYLMLSARDKNHTSALNYLINNALGNDAEDVEKKKQARGIISPFTVVIFR